MPQHALAQGAGAAQAAAVNDSPPRLLIEGAVGLARFVDDAPVEFGYVGGSGRAYLSRRVSLGPEFMYMNGPDGSHQWHLTGVLTVDLVEGRRSAQWSRVVPYVVAAGGYQRMTNLCRHRDVHFLRRLCQRRCRCTHRSEPAKLVLRRPRVPAWLGTSLSIRCNIWRQVLDGFDCPIARLPDCPIARLDCRLPDCFPIARLFPDCRLPIANCRCRRQYLRIFPTISR